MHYIIGTRGSKLALLQTESVMKKLKKAYPDDSFSIKIIKTTGDKNQIQALDKIGSKGLFTDEIEKELLSGEIAMAVHSMKDMPDTPQKGLTFSKAWKREDSRDVLVLKNHKSLDELPIGATIATGSKRRAYQIKKIRPDINIVGIRGNVDTRIRKLRDENENLDGIVLAAAGLNRIGRADEITQYLEPDEMIPAPSQGTLALEVKEDNVTLLEKLNALSDNQSQLAVDAERGFLKAIGGDCHLPIGAYLNEQKELMALFGDENGSVLARTVVKLSGESKEEIENAVQKAVKEIKLQLEDK